jgi:phosphatidylserine decarboxylase
MMNPIVYINRTTGQEEIEEVYGGNILQFLYGDRLFNRLCRYLLSRFPLFSAFYGYLQKTRFSQHKIQPFIDKFGVNTEEFAKSVSEFQTFNDFFIRQLKPGARPIASGEKTAVMPADGRYLFFPVISQAEGFFVKGQKFELEQLLQSRSLAEEYQAGTMIIARLCPTDYHRFHFPIDCIPGETQFINGYLYSVNPIALKKNIHTFTENKRRICTLDSVHFGKVLFLEIGATSVGSIHETYTPQTFYRKGEEKGYFSFGGSALVLLFKPNTLSLDTDLITHPYCEIKCLMGQSLGQA